MKPSAKEPPCLSAAFPHRRARFPSTARYATAKVRCAAHTPPPLRRPDKIAAGFVCCFSKFSRARFSRMRCFSGHGGVVTLGRSSEGAKPRSAGRQHTYCVVPRSTRRPPKPVYAISKSDERQSAFARRWGRGHARLQQPRRVREEGLRRTTQYRRICYVSCQNCRFRIDMCRNRRGKWGEGFIPLGCSLVCRHATTSPLKEKSLCGVAP